MKINYLLYTIVFLGIFICNNRIEAYGEPNKDGLPSWFERSNLVLVNAVRIAPKQYLKYYTQYHNQDILDEQVYPSVPPLYYDESLGQASCAHSTDMAQTPCFSHPSCDGTDTFDRIRSYYQCSELATENIAAGFNSPLHTNNQWICDDGSGDPFSTSCASDGGSDGHRKNIMSPQSKVIGVGYSFSEQSDLHSYWTQDFGEELCDADQSQKPIHSGSHVFPTAKSILFMVDWYSESLKDPVNPLVIISGEPYPLTLKMGKKNKGIYVYQTTPNTKECRDYYFTFESEPLNSTSMSSKTNSSSVKFRYPDSGFLYTYDENECLISFSMDGHEFRNETSSQEASSSQEGSQSNSHSVENSESSESMESSDSSSSPNIDKDSLGCFKDGGVAHDLSGSVRFDRNLTNTKCKAFCSKQLYKYSGTSMGNQCYCGSEYGHYGKAQNQSECSFKCGGNSTEICGGNNRLTIGRSSFIGCYSLGESLDNFDQCAISPQNMSVQNCKSYCKASGYQYSGLTKGKYCLCGNQLLQNENELDRSKCDSICTNSKFDFCGGESSISLYNNIHSHTLSYFPNDFKEDKSLFVTSSSSLIKFSIFSFLLVFIILAMI
ncbi:WSC domain-containing protein [Tieghemostelium lacteum]|uniref:WSC domain-containing protein n=1 Tax=Tieghemostelium lacteum TaxID=361077 RepID=A0A151ZRX3_TIELA|nr:WSC domain-containing protein [Tieghemostelium lacteum]|eukprot:KYQ96669.1 WSC domain-containing protein [Tieghemostelium lacteum]